GKPLDPDTLTNPDYWAHHARHTVRFADAVAELRAAGVNTYLEIGPDAALTPQLRTADPTAVAVPTLRRDQPEATTLLTAVASAHTRGVPVDLATLNGPHARRVSLPTYAFQYTSHWPPPPAATVAAPEARLWNAVESGDLAGLAET